MLCVRQSFKQLHKPCLAPIFWTSGDGRCSFYGNIKPQKPRFTYAQRITEQGDFVGTRVCHFTGDILIKGALCELRFEHIAVWLCQPENISLLQSSFIHDLLQPLCGREWPHVSAPFQISQLYHALNKSSRESVRKVQFWCCNRNRLVVISKRKFKKINPKLI